MKKTFFLLVVTAFLCAFPCFAQEVDEPLTRAEAADWLVEHLGISVSGDLSGYTDVPADAWYADALSHAVGAGLFQGYQGALRPQDPLQQWELDLVFSRLTQSPVSFHSAQTVTQHSFEQQVSALLGPALSPEQTGLVSGSATIQSSGQFQGLIIQGDLWIADGAGDVKLTDVQVDGRVLIRSHGAVKLDGLTSCGSMVVLGSPSLSCQSTALPSVTLRTDHASVQGSILSMALETTGTFSLESASVDSISILADQSVLLLDEKSRAKQINIPGNGVVLAGAGFVDQVMASGQNIHIEVDGGVVFALEGCGVVWAQGTAIPAGTYAVGDTQPEKPPVVPPSWPSWGGGTGGSSGSDPDPDPDPTPEPEPELDDPQPPAADSVKIWPAGGNAQLKTVAKEDTLSIQATASIQPGYPSDAIAALYQNRQADVDFSTLGLSFVLPSLPAEGQTILRFESQCLAALGYTSQDNTEQCQFTAKGDRVEAVVTIPNQSLLARGALELPLPFCSQEDPIPLSVDWGQGPLLYSVDVSGISFASSVLGEPSIVLPSQQPEPSGQCLLSVTWEGAQSLSLYDVQDRLLCQQEGTSLHWDLRDEEGAYPQPGTVLRLVAQGPEGQQAEREIHLESADLMASIHREDGFYFEPLDPDWLENGEQIFEALQSLFAEGILTQDKNVLRVDTSRFTPEFTAWCNETFGKPCVPIQVLSETSTSEAIPPDDAWGGMSLVWLPTEPAEPCLQAYRFDDGSSCYILLDA